MESIKYPFFGVMFHPEKAGFDMRKKRNINHEPMAIELGKYIAYKFIEQASKNNNMYLLSNKLHLGFKHPVSYFEGSVYDKVFLFKNY